MSIETSDPFFQRLTLLVGAQTFSALQKTRVIVFGLGGVGSWCAEALVRSGIGKIALVDSDKVCPSNVNRQLQAAHSTIGCLKTAALEARLRDINPHCEIESFPQVFSRETADVFDIARADFVIDAIDSLKHKLDLIETSIERGARFFSSMGMAQKLDPAQIKTADIWKTNGCPLARLVRYGLRKRGFRKHFTAVYSPERLPRFDVPQVDFSAPDFSAPAVPTDNAEQNAASLTGSWDAGKKVINGTSVTVTATAGMILASLVLQSIYKRANNNGEKNE
jgi:tRNA A37 threonylcarbamoyladenosine dehydratase